MTHVTITNRTVIGYGYNTSPRQTSTGYTFDYPTEPTHTGTIKTLSAKMRNDRTLQSLTTTLYRSCYFAKYSGQWHRITNAREVFDQFDYCNATAATAELDC
jgi:hypothetical protein